MWTELSIDHGVYKGWLLTRHLFGSPHWLARKGDAYLSTTTKHELLTAVDQLDVGFNRDIVMTWRNDDDVCDDSSQGLRLIHRNLRSV